MPFVKWRWRRRQQDGEGSLHYRIAVKYPIPGPDEQAVGQGHLAKLAAAELRSEGKIKPPKKVMAKGGSMFFQSIVEAINGMTKAIYSNQGYAELHSERDYHEVVERVEKLEETIGQCEQTIQDLQRRLFNLEEVCISPVESPSELISRFRSLELKFGDLQVELMKQSAKKPRSRKKTKQAKI